VRALLSARLAGRPTRANFRTGTLTVCTMVPMRSVPHRVVCLLGLDDGVFPRFGLDDGDDVLARRPVTGERDVRAEDRQLMHDAILAATESLVITYTGANEYTGQPRPPAVPVGELLDALDHTTEGEVREAVLVKHPLQPFDRKNLEPGRLGTPGPFTFDPTALVAAQSAAGWRPARPEFLPTPLPTPRNHDVTLAELLAFFRDPVGLELLDRIGAGAALACALSRASREISRASCGRFTSSICRDMSARIPTAYRRCSGPAWWVALRAAV
jgi:exodeoxyribonuclease V gamma subunit